MAVDMTATLINQRHLVRCIERLELIDYKLSKESILMNYRSLQYLSIFLIIVTLFRKYLMILFGFFVFELNHIQLTFMYVPIFVSMLSKIWFVLIVSNIRKKFDAINLYLDELGNTLKASKENTKILPESSMENQTVQNHDNGINPSMSNENVEINDSKYLHKEIFTRPKPKFYNAIVRTNVNIVRPLEHRKNAAVGFIDTNQQNDDIDSIPTGESSRSTSNSIKIGDKFDKQLTNLCFLHDEICEIASIANYMFSFQMLMLMAYGFLAITAQLYFVYCSLAGQVIQDFCFHLQTKKKQNISIFLDCSTTISFC